MKQYVIDNEKLLDEWDSEMNTELSPESTTIHSNKKVWWRCKNGHKWVAMVNDRSRGNGCPYCSGRKVLKGFNDLATVNPKLAQEWNYEKNYPLTPMEVSKGFGKKVWWICGKCKNEWESVIGSRNKGCGCPKCKIQKIKESSSKKVAQYDLEHNLIKEWSSMTSASNELDISLSLISKCCNGKIKTCGGFCWEYI